jgi:hypothetical protein
VTDEQIAEKVLDDVFKRAATGRANEVVPLALFSTLTAYVALQVLPDDVRMATNRHIAKIRQILDDKIQERNKSRSSIVLPDPNKN